ncbi:MAG: hypothetical protein DMG04_29070 [Acidobacteria bacterium]|nr:MAG: hypothetical protein DMG04_29070 [Acidobacteriota bacterium]PYR04652.1 MAG: hypothetical protein DMF99_31240 [Acidobacteriota bacterium]
MPAESRSETGMSDDDRRWGNQQEPDARHFELRCVELGRGPTADQPSDDDVRAVGFGTIGAA